MWREHAFTDEIKTNGNYKNRDTLFKLKCSKRDQSQRGDTVWQLLLTDCIKLPCVDLNSSILTWSTLYIDGLWQIWWLCDKKLQMFCLWSLFSDHFTLTNLLQSWWGWEKYKMRQEKRKKHIKDRRLTMSSANVFMCMFCWREGTTQK